MIGYAACGIGAAFLLVGAQHVHGGLAWLVGVPFAFALDGARRFSASVALGVVFAASCTLLGEMPWVAATGESYFGLTPVVAWPGAVLVALAHSLVVGSCLGVVLCAAAGGDGRWFVLRCAAAWMIWEELTLWVIPYYPWASLSATQLEHLAVVQAVAFLGQRGLAALILASGVSLGRALRQRRGRPAVVAVSIPVLLSLLGSMRLQDERLPPSTCRVTAIDAGIAAPRPPAGEVWRRHVQATRASLAATDDVDVIVWPESALTADPTTVAALRYGLESLVAEISVPLIAGGPRRAWDGDWQERRFNAAFLVRPGATLEAYDKRRLVPLAEYWPGPMVLRPRSWSVEETTPGERDVLWHAGDCELGVLICFEADDPWRARALRRAGAQVLLVLSNDAQLPAAAAAAERRQARLRAVESGMPVVRAANRGGTFMVDPFGRVRSPSSEPATYTADSTLTAPALWVAPWLLGAAAVLTFLRIAELVWRSSSGAETGSHPVSRPTPE